MDRLQLAEAALALHDASTASQLFLFFLECQRSALQAACAGEDVLASHSPEAGLATLEALRLQSTAHNPLVDAVTTALSGLAASLCLLNDSAPTRGTRGSHEAQYARARVSALSNAALALAPDSARALAVAGEMAERDGCACLAVRLLERLRACPDSHEKRRGLDELLPRALEARRVLLASKALNLKSPDLAVTEGEHMLASNFSGMTGEIKLPELRGVPVVELVRATRLPSGAANLVKKAELYLKLFKPTLALGLARALDFGAKTSLCRVGSWNLCASRCYSVANNRRSLSEKIAHLSDLIIKQRWTVVALQECPGPMACETDPDIGDVFVACIAETLGASWRLAVAPLGYESGGFVYDSCVWESLLGPSAIVYPAAPTAPAATATNSCGTTAVAAPAATATNSCSTTAVAAAAAAASDFVAVAAACTNSCSGAAATVTSPRSPPVCNPYAFSRAPVMCVLAPKQRTDTPSPDSSVCSPLADAAPPPWVLALVSVHIKSGGAEPTLQELRQLAPSVLPWAEEHLAYALQCREQQRVSIAAAANAPLEVSCGPSILSSSSSSSGTNNVVTADKSSSAIVKLTAAATHATRRMLCVLGDFNFGAGSAHPVWNGLRAAGLQSLNSAATNLHEFTATGDEHSYDNAWIRCEPRSTLFEARAHPVAILGDELTDFSAALSSLQPRTRLVTDFFARNLREAFRKHVVASWSDHKPLHIDVLDAGFDAAIVNSSDSCISDSRVLDVGFDAIVGSSGRGSPQIEVKAASSLKSAAVSSAPRTSIFIAPAARTAALQDVSVRSLSIEEDAREVTAAVPHLTGGGNGPTSGSEAAEREREVADLAASISALAVGVNHNPTTIAAGGTRASSASSSTPAPPRSAHSSSVQEGATFSPRDEDDEVYDGESSTASPPGHRRTKTVDVAASRGGCGFSLCRK